MSRAEISILAALNVGHQGHAMSGVRCGTGMRFTTAVPCRSCPYRRDVPVGTWHRAEFENLLAQDADGLGGHLFGCHATRKLPEQDVCAGWLLDQRRRGVPSIQLRLALVGSHEARALLQVASPPPGVELYPSIAAMCRANGVRARMRRTYGR